MLPFYQYGNNDKYLRLKEDVTIGGLYYGSFLDKGNDKLVIERHKDSTTRTMSFERTDGEPAIVRICPNTTGSRQNELVFGARKTNAGALVGSADAVKATVATIANAAIFRTIVMLILSTTIP